MIHYNNPHTRYNTGWAFMTGNGLPMYANQVEAYLVLNSCWGSTDSLVSVTS